MQTQTDQPMDERQVFVLADRALLGVVNRIRTDQWAMTMPADFQTRAADHAPTLRELINYHAYDDAWVPDMLAGRTMAEVGADQHKGNLLGDDPDDLVRGIWDQVRPHAEEWRSYGVLGPAVPVPEDAPLQDRLLGLTGRQPD